MVMIHLVALCFGSIRFSETSVEEMNGIHLLLYTVVKFKDLCVWLHLQSTGHRCCISLINPGSSACVSVVFLTIFRPVHLRLLGAWESAVLNVISLTLVKSRFSWQRFCSNSSSEAPGWTNRRSLVYKDSWTSKYLILRFLSSVSYVERLKTLAHVCMSTSQVFVLINVLSKSSCWHGSKFHLLHFATLIHTQAPAAVV